MSKCIFCNIEQEKIYETSLLYAIYDKYPVTKGHVLIIPKQHVKDYFDASDLLRQEINITIIKLKEILDKKYSPDGYNIGINNGVTAGQTIFHLHVHLIPRYKGDVKDPTGGVRGVIPNNQKY